MSKDNKELRTKRLKADRRTAKNLKKRYPWFGEVEVSKHLEVLDKAKTLRKRFIDLRRGAGRRGVRDTHQKIGNDAVRLLTGCVEFGPPRQLIGLISDLLKTKTASNKKTPDAIKDFLATVPQEIKDLYDQGNLTELHVRALIEDDKAPDFLGPAALSKALSELGLEVRERALGHGRVEPAFQRARNVLIARKVATAIEKKARRRRRHCASEITLLRHALWP